MIDEFGYGQIVGRAKDMLIRGGIYWFIKSSFSLFDALHIKYFFIHLIKTGENVYPREIEELLHTHPAVAEVHVRRNWSWLYDLNNLNYWIGSGYWSARLASGWRGVRLDPTTIGRIGYRGRVASILQNKG